MTPATTASQPSIVPITGKRFDALERLTARYHKEARRAAKAKAYYGACILIGSALEASLLMMCSIRTKEVEAYVRTLSAERRPPRQLTKWGLNDLVNTATALDWIPGRKTKHARTRPGDWMHVVRELRNLAHPGKHIRDYHKVKVRKAQWADAKAIYDLAIASLLDLVKADLRAEMRRRGIIPTD